MCWRTISFEKTSSDSSDVIVDSTSKEGVALHVLVWKISWLNELDTCPHGNHFSYLCTKKVVEILSNALTKTNVKNIIN